MPTSTRDSASSRRWFLKEVSAGIGLAALAGCSSRSNNSNTGQNGTTGTDTSTPLPPEEIPKGGTLQVAASGDPENLDPHTTTIDTAQKVLDNVMEGLFELDQNLQLRPVLAKNHSITDDTTYEISLRKGVKFHDGSAFTSADVKYTIERILDPDLGSPQAANFKSVDTIETPDKHTVRFTLKKPFAPFLTALAVSAAIVPEGAKTKTLKQQPTGTGPFKLKTWRTDDKVALKKFEDYHVDTLPYLNGVTFDVIPEAATRLTQLKSGSANVMFGIPFQKTNQLKSGSNTELQTVSGLWKQGFWFNTNRKPFDDPTVRRALSHAINRKQLVQGVLFGQGEPAYSPVVPTSHWRDEIKNVNPTKGGPKKAKALFKEAGIEPSSVKTTIKASRTPGPTYADTATLIQSQLTQLGMNVDVEIMDFSTWLQEVWVDKNFSLSIGSWAGRIDPDGWYYRQYHTDGAWNRWNYSNQQVDKLLERGRSTLNASERAKIYSEVEKITSQEAPMTYLYFKEDMTGLDKSVGGYRLSAAHQAEFEDTYLNE